MKTSHKIIVAIGAVLFFCIIGVVIAVNAGNEPRHITLNEFDFKLLKPHYVKKIVEVNNEYAEVYLKDSALRLPQFRELGNSPDSKYVIKNTDEQTLINNINSAKKKFNINEDILMEAENRGEAKSFIAFFILPFILIGAFITGIVLLIVWLSK